jgi:hypothetical protein
MVNNRVVGKIVTQTKKGVSFPTNSSREAISLSNNTHPGNNSINIGVNKPNNLD